MIHDKPELEQRPVILQHRTRRGLCVLACSRLARQQGVQVNLPVAEATALLRRADHKTTSPTSGEKTTLHLETHAPAEDRAALIKLATWCHRFSPLVGLEEAAAPDTLLLNVTGVTSLFGGEPAFAEQITRSFHQQRLGVSLGLSNTLGAAWALAHFGDGAHFGYGAHFGHHGAHSQAESNHAPSPETPSPETPSPETPSPETPSPETPSPEMASPEETIQRLPLAALRLPDETVDILQRLGLQQIGELLELPRVELESRFGPQLLQRLDQTFGKITELIQPIQPPLEFVAEWLFEYPVPQRKAVERVVRQLVERLCFTLADHDRGVVRLRGRIVCQDTLPVTWEVGLFRASADAEHVWQLVETQLERLPLPGPATSVALQANHHARLLARQQELFDQHQRNVDSPQIATLVDCLASQLGREAVVRCVLQRDAQPERAFCYVPLVGGDTKNHKTGKRTTGSRPPIFGLLDRPLQLLDPPHVLEVMAVAPDGPPISFCYLGNKHEVTRHWGPERIETGWWRQRGIRRDYYRVETVEGRRFWLFRCLHERRWQLHGVFE